MKHFSFEYALLAMQGALLGEVTPQLRAVFVDLDTDEEIMFIRFYYDGEVSEIGIDLWSCVACEASAHLGPYCFEDSKIERIDYSKKVPTRGYCAYFRKENTGLADYSFPRVKIIESSIAYALLAAQYALLGKVTPELRAVVVDVETEKSLLYIRFYYDGEISQDLYNLWMSAGAEAKADFGRCILDAAVERVDYPNNYPFRGRYAYRRKEDRVD